MRSALVQEAVLVTLVEERNNQTRPTTKQEKEKSTRD
jgi:hypothetical protein